MIVFECLRLPTVKILWLSILLFMAFSVRTYSQEQEASLPEWFLFYRLMDMEDLSAVVWGTGDTEENYKVHAMIIRVPDWLNEAGGHIIEEKASGARINYVWLPFTLRSFCASYNIDPETITKFNDARIIDLGAYSEKFEQVDTRTRRQVDSFVASWSERSNWRVQPRPEPQPPAWLGAPLNRHFYDKAGK